MSNEVTIKVTGRNEANPALDTAVKSVGKLGEATGFAQKRADELKTKLKELHAQIDKLGADGSKSIEEIEIAQGKLRKEIKATQAELIDFERMLKTLANSAASVTEGLAFAGMEAFKKSALTLATNPATLGVAAAVGTVFASAAGAAIGGALILGTGAGGMVGGIMAASQDSRVKSAWKDAVKSMTADTIDFGQPFAGPVAESIGLLKEGVTGLLGGELGSSMKSLAAYVPVVAKGLLDLGERAAPGIAKAMQTAKPVMDALAQELPEIGDAIGEMFREISEDPERAVAAVRMLSHAIQETILLVGDLTSTLMSMYFDIATAVDPVIQLQAKLFGWMPVIGDQMKRAAEESAQIVKGLDSDAPARFSTTMDDVAGNTERAKAEMQDLARAIDDVFDRQMDVDQANVKFQLSLHSLRRELAEGTRTLASNTEEGLKNQDSLLTRIEIAERIRDVTIKQTGDLDAANAAFREHIDIIEKLGIQAGLSKAELEALLAPYREGMQVAIDFHFAGLERGMQTVRELNDLLVGPTSGFASVPGKAHGGVIGAASGGARGGRVMVGEYGPEVVDLPYGSTVTTADTTAAMSGGGGGMPMILVQLIDPMTGEVTRQKLIDGALNRGTSPDLVAAAYP